MQNNSKLTIDLGTHLVGELDEALAIFQTREPETNWTRERVLMLAVTYGLRELLRKHPRVKAGIPGHYWRLLPASIKGAELTIDDVSLGGIRFRTAEPNLFRENEVIEIQFSLDPAGKRVIHRKVIVSHITGNQVGAEFCETDDAYHRISSEALEEYLVARAGVESS